MTQVNEWINNIQKRGFSSLFPPVCVLCGDPGSQLHGLGIDLCPACHNELPRLTASCARCAEPLPPMQTSHALCGRCQTRPPAYDRCQAMFLYQPPTDHLIQSLKFYNRLELAQLLGTLMANWLEKVIDSTPDVLIPIPLHKNRLQDRGFNQAAEIARPVAKHLNLKLDTKSCTRIKSTSPQSDLSRKERLKNVKGAFEVSGSVSGHIAVIDDVMTTGSTAHEFARTLQKAGADRVEIWVCARA